MHSLKEIGRGLNQERKYKEQKYKTHFLEADNGKEEKFDRRK